MSISVHGHLLPNLLVSMIETKKWKYNESMPEPQWSKLLESMSLPPLRLFMNDVETMNDYGFVSIYEDFPSREDNPNAFCVEDMLELYSLASSKRSGHVHSTNLLDIDNAVCIAGSADEEFLFLDYRDNPLNPSVLVTAKTTETGYKWAKIAPDFEALAMVLGLIDPNLT